MHKSLSALLVATFVLSGCGAIRDSAVNPFNWFGKARSTAVVNDGTANPLIPQRSGMSLRRGPQAYQGQPVYALSGLKVERASGGAIIRVDGLAATQGSYEVFLTSETNGKAVDGVLTYTLKAIVPPNRPQGTKLSRELTAAQFVSDRGLEGVRTIRVQSATNVLTVRR